MLVALGFVAGLIVMLVVDRSPSVSPPVASQQSQQPDNARPTPTSNDSTASTLDAASLDPVPNPIDLLTITDLMHSEPDFTQSVLLFNILHNSDESKLRELIRQSETVSPTSRRRNTQIAIFRRFAELDPVGALNEIKGFQTHQQKFLVEAVFREWSISDLDRALEATKQLVRENKRAAITAILTTRDDLSQELRHEMAVQMGDEELGLEVITESSQYDAIENPSEAFSKLLNDSINNRYQIELLVRIAEEWIERDGLQVLPQISNKITLENDQFSEVLSGIYRVAAAVDPGVALEHAQALSVATRGRMMRSIARAWAVEDYHQALEGVSSVEALSTRSELQSIVFEAWGERDPRELLQNLHLVPARLVEEATGTAIRSIAYEDPEEAVGLLKTIKVGGYHRSVLYGLVSEWSRQHAEAAFDWVLTEPRISNIRDRLVSVVFRELSLIDPKRAMSLALKDSRGLEKEVVFTIAVRNAEFAVALLPRVREEYALDAYSSVGRALIYDLDPEAALELGNQLSGDQRDTYLSRTISTWASELPQSLIEAIGTLPSEALKSHAAKELTSANEQWNSLSEDQLRYLSKFLTEEENEQTD